MKKYYFILLIFLLGVTTSVSSQIISPFTDYNYEEEITIAGSKGMYTMYIPADENINVKNSYINLEFECSNVIDYGTSHLSILLDDIPVETRFLKNKNRLVRFKIPVRTKDIVSGFIKLTIKTNLKIGDKICEIYSEGGFWVKLTSNSFFSYHVFDVEEKHTKKTISPTIPDLEYIVLSSENNMEEIEYASYIKFYLRRIYGLDLKIKNIDFFEKSVIENSLILMPFDKLEEKVKDDLPPFINNMDGLVSMYTDSYKDPRTLKVSKGENIVITGKTNSGLSKASLFVLQKHLLNSCYVDYVFVNEKTTLLDIPKRKDYEPVYFNELGAQKNVLQGIGYIESNIVIPRSSFGSNVKKIEVQIKGKYRPLDEEEQGYVNLYFNEDFLRSYKLDSTGDLNLIFDFDDVVMQQENNFKYEFYFVPKGGLCKRTAATFYGQIDVENSYFKAIGYENSKSLSFFKFPENFQSNPIVIYTDLEAQHKMINTISELIDIMNPGEVGLSGFIYPSVKKANLDEIEEDVVSSKIVISSNRTKFSNFFKDAPFISFNGDSVIYKSEDINPFSDVRYQKELGFNQLFYYNDNPVMLINLPENYNENTLSSLVLSIKDQTISNMGNVIISNNKDSYSFDLRNLEKHKGKSYLASLLEDFWSKYRLFIVSVLLILAILILMFIFQKSKESKEKIENEK